jgi:hypothetical protein
MKSILAVFTLALVLFVVGLAGPGCATRTPTTIAGQTLVSTAQTVDSTMRSWANWVALKEKTPAPVTQESINAVDRAYMRYVAAMATARTAYVTSTSTGGSGLTVALAALEGCRSELLALITLIQK